MQSHIVLYKAFQLNPDSAEKIITRASELLGSIPGVVFFFVGRIVTLGRAVGSSEFDVVLNITFSDDQAYKDYMEHPNHIKFVEFVLHGYMLDGSISADPEKEFIDHILKGSSHHLWAVNPNVPCEEIVWGGEMVVDAIG